MSNSLGARLKTATHELHREAEGMPFMQALLRARLDRAAYVDLLRNLHPIYEALEAALEQHAALPALQPLCLGGLARQEALAQDLHTLHGPRWAQQGPMLPAAQGYVQHLRHLADHEPTLLAAHAYVRYLGDLSGGQLLAPLVTRALKLPAGEGVAFYDFGGAQQTRQMSADFRAGIERIGQFADDALGQRIVDEACHAFVLHRPLFEQLADRMDTGGQGA